MSKTFFTAGERLYGNSTLCPYPLLGVNVLHFSNEHNVAALQAGAKTNFLWNSWTPFFKFLKVNIGLGGRISKLRGDSICNENPFITPSTNALGVYVICQTKAQSVAVIMVHETLFYLSQFNKLQTF